MKKESTFKCIKATGSFKVGDITDNELCGSLPEYFSQYKFTTKDGVDIYEGEKSFSFLKNDFEVIHGPLEYDGDSKNLKYFSTLEAVHSYLYELNKPKFYPNKPYHLNGGGIVFINTVGDDWGNGYGFDEYGKWIDSIGIKMSARINKEATPEEWESALIKEAERRYTAGCIINKCPFGYADYSDEKKFAQVKLKGNNFYLRGSYLLEVTGNDYVWKNGIWAEIVEEPKEKKNTCSSCQFWKKKDNENMGICFKGTKGKLSVPPSEKKTLHKGIAIRNINGSMPEIEVLFGSDYGCIHHTKTI